VHDPKSIGQTLVKANVKLRFTNKSGQDMVVVRSMELKQSKKSTTFKQMEGVIRTQDANGNRVQLSHKCTELDKEVPALLGIGKAIIDSVLFCHQEEASWPLQDPATLKKRFDDIFDSTRYTKALDAFKKTEKELNGRCKDIKEDMAGLKSHMHAAQGFRSDLREQSEVSIMHRAGILLQSSHLFFIAQYEEDLCTEKNNVATELAELDLEVQRLNDIIGKGEQLQQKIDAIKNQRNSHKMALRKQAEMVEEDLTEKYSLEELETMLREFDNQMMGQKEEEERLQRKAQSIQSDIDNLHKQELELKSKVGKFEAEKDAQDKRLKEQYTLMETIAKHHEIDLDATLSQSQTQTQNTSFVGMSQQSLATTKTTRGQVTSEEMAKFLRVTDRKTQELNDSLKKHRERVQAEEDKFQRELADLSGKLKAVEYGKFSFWVV
jgi:DNA repair protein RAD50